MKTTLILLALILPHPQVTKKTARPVVEPVPNLREIAEERIAKKLRDNCRSEMSKKSYDIAKRELIIAQIVDPDPEARKMYDQMLFELEYLGYVLP